MSLTFDKTKIGKKIARGGDRHVYMYGPDHVVKISSLSFIGGKKMHDKLMRDYEICKKYFPEFVAETIDVTVENGGTHTEIQPYIKGESIQKKHVTNTKVRSQLELIKSAVEKMVQDGYAPLDLMGYGCIITPCLSSIMIDEENTLHITDTTLLEGKTVPPFGIVLDLIAPLVIRRQPRLLNEFLK